MKKEIRDILKKLLSGKQHIKFTDLQILMKALSGKSAQYGFEVADIIEREFNDGRINEEDALLLIETMLDDDNNDRHSGEPGLVDLTPDKINPIRPIRVPDYDIAVAYGVQVYPTSNPNWIDSASSVFYNSNDVQCTANAATHLSNNESEIKVKYGIPNLNKTDNNKHNPFFEDKGKKKTKTLKNDEQKDSKNE